MKPHGLNPDEETSKAGGIAQAGALISAILASACCWLPLLLIAFGVSGGALAARFEAARPGLLPVTFVLLGLAFYFAYRRPKTITTESSETGETCPAPIGVQKDAAPCCAPGATKGFAIKRLNKTMLWVVAVFVFAFAFFPNYAGFLLKGGGTAQVRTDAERVEWSMTIKGMTCQACAARIQSELVKLPGVLKAKVDYEQGIAMVVATEKASETDLRKAVEAVGYSVLSAANATKKQGDIR